MAANSSPACCRRRRSNAFLPGYRGPRRAHSGRRRTPNGRRRAVRSPVAARHPRSALEVDWPKSKNAPVCPDRTESAVPSRMSTMAVEVIQLSASQLRSPDHGAAFKPIRSTL
jgi:hypothetical protein